MLKSFIIGAALAITTTIINTQIASSVKADDQLVRMSNSVSVPNAFDSVDNHIPVLIAGSIVFLLIRNQHQVSKTRTSRKWANKHLQNKLLNRLDGDVAERLVSSAKRSNPGKSEQWYREKVTYDLNRDRR